MTAPRSLAVFLHQAGKAAEAAAMAALVSLPFISGTLAINSPVAGFTTWCANMKTFERCASRAVLHAAPCCRKTSP